MKTWSLYRHTSPSGKVYIGITSRAPEIRWGRHGCHYIGQVFVNAILKYGWDNIKHEVLFTNLTEKRAKLLEIELIRHYKNLGISYNMTDGGEGTKGVHPSEETRAKMREAQRRMDKSERIAILNKNRDQIAIKHRKPVVQLSLEGHYIATFDCGKFASKATNIDASMITACCKGRQFKAGGFLWMYEKEYQQHINSGTLKDVLSSLISKANSIPGSYIRTREMREAISNRRKGKDCRSEKTKLLMQQYSIEHIELAKKPIMQLTLDDSPIRVFSCGAEVSKELGFSGGYISQCCNGSKKYAYGFKWKFITKEEYNGYKNNLAA